MQTPRSVLERDLVVAITPSRRIVAAAVAVHAGGVVAVLSLEGATWLKLAFLVAILIAGFRFRYRLGATGFVSELRLRVDGQFELVTAAGREAVSLDAADLVEPWLTVLVFRSSSGRRHAVLLLPDNTDGDAFRRLRARLRLGLWCRHASTGGVRGDGS